MNETTELIGIVEELIGAMHLQAGELEKLVVQVERQSGPLRERPQFSLVLSELSALQVRVAKLAAEGASA
jgi:hypothetical protein